MTEEAKRAAERILEVCKYDGPLDKVDELAKVRALLMDAHLVARWALDLREENRRLLADIDTYKREAAINERDEAGLREENERLRELLGYLRTPAENALRECRLHDVAEPTNVHIRWSTSIETARALLDALRSGESA